MIPEKGLASDDAILKDLRKYRSGLAEDIKDFKYITS
jgi:hypothetical protein